jgi:hypothetical protein
VLALVERAVADPDRLGAATARQVRQRSFTQIPLTAQPVHDLDAAAQRGFHQEGEVLVGLRIEAQAQKCPQHEP